MRLFILDASGLPLRCDDLMTWAKWHDTPQRIIARDEIGDVLVSTVFMGLDAGMGTRTPLFFETLVFRGEHNDMSDRYATRDEALAGHREIVQAVRRSQR